MLKIKVICIGKIKENYLKDAIVEYSKRLSKYCNLEIIELEDERLSNNMSMQEIDNIKEKESIRIKNRLFQNTYLFILDLRGQEFSSEKFAEKINDITVNENSNITFVIGGTVRTFR